MRTVLILSQGEYGVRLTDIASHFGVSKASACVAITNLEKRGFVVRDANRLISLTPDGEREASRVLDNFTVVNLFLTSKLNVDPHTALMDAGALEHAVSKETVDALRMFLKVNKSMD